MQYQVPQFLDVEDKVIGPLTIKQFLYVAGSVGLAYMSWRFIPYLGLFLALAVAILGGALGFYKFNNKPFIFLLESGFNYLKSSRLYVWKRTEKALVETHIDLSNFQETKHTGGIPLSSTSSTKLSDLSWSIGVVEKTGSQDMYSKTGII